MNKQYFLTTIEFEKEFKRLKKKYRSLPDDLKEFKEDYLANPTIGNDLGGSLRKIRFSIKSKGKGKSGGGRLIIYELVVNVMFKHIVFVTIYDKSEMETMTTAHYKAILNRNDFK